MRALLVGGSGFLGSHVQGALLARGIEVCTLDRLPSRYGPSDSRVHLFIGEQDDPVTLARALDGVDAVVHMASATIPATSAADPSGDVQANLLPFLRHLEVVRSRAVRRFVFFSSGGTVYGLPSSLPVNESHSTNPIVSHGIIKLAMEKYLTVLLRDSGVETTVLRVGNAYGERQAPFGNFGAVAAFLGCFATRRPIHVWGSGEVVRDYVHAADVAEACALALTTDVAQGTFNIGTGRGHSLNQILRLIADVTAQPPPEIRREPQRGFDVPAIVLDNTLAQKGLNWLPKVALEEGVRRTWEWVSHLELPK